MKGNKKVQQMFSVWVFMFKRNITISNPIIPGETHFFFGVVFLAAFLAGFLALVAFLATFFGAAFLATFLETFFGAAFLATTFLATLAITRKMRLVNSLIDKGYWDMIGLWYLRQWETRWQSTKSLSLRAWVIST